MTRRKKVISAAILAGIVFLFWYFKYDTHFYSLQLARVPRNFWGVTFSKKYAQELGIDWKEAYLAILDDLNIKNIRLPVYWDDVEKTQGEFTYDDYDWMLAEGEERGVRFILNVGRRLPRWPECHQPSWTEGLPDQQMKEQHLAAVEDMIQHFKSSNAIRYWQLENEYFFPWFGRCPKADMDLIRQEIRLLKLADARPLVLTDSGELNSWRKAAQLSDILGITIYRVVWNNYFGYFRWPWPGLLYRVKAQLAGKQPATTMVAELQAEPWPSHFRSVTAITPAEARQSFSIQQFDTNSEIARRTGFSQAYYWGVEWWYWLKTQGDASMWEHARTIIEQNGTN